MTLDLQQQPQKTKRTKLDYIKSTLQTKNYHRDERERKMVEGFFSFTVPINFQQIISLLPIKSKGLRLTLPRGLPVLSNTFVTRLLSRTRFTCTLPPTMAKKSKKKKPENEGFQRGSSEESPLPPVVSSPTSTPSSSPRRVPSKACDAR